MTTNKLTLDEVANKSAEDKVPPVSDLWKRIGGQDSELEKLLAGTLIVIDKATSRTQKIDALIGLLAMGTIVGYYGACQTYEDVLGIGEGPPC